MRVDGNYLRPLSPGTAKMVSRSVVARAAREAFPGTPRTGKVSMFALLDTDNELSKRQPDGKMRREIVNRPVWVVLYPKAPVGTTIGNGRWMENLVVFFDGRTGKFIVGMTA